MDAFKLRNTLVGDYASYVQSSLLIRDPRIATFVDQQMAAGALWPDPLIQLSPAYQTTATVDQVVDAGVLAPFCGSFFRLNQQSLKLYQHQRTAIDLAQADHNYVVTTGTGSGKSLTYLLPIVDAIVRNQPEAGGVRAIIVYPMNALINSQLQALDRFKEQLPEGDCPLRYARYTGQENDAEKQAIRANPPHILLTNYVMLELMLTRPAESVLVEAAGQLQFLVLDELHTYRGRQGADIALLVRRLRERSGNPHLQCIGTSATMASGETQMERAQAVAAVASRLFGARVEPPHVVDETLRWSVSRQTEPTISELRAAVAAPLGLSMSWEAFQRNPLTTWIETTFGLRTDADGRLRRREPLTLLKGAAHLAALIDVDVEACAVRLQQLFSIGSAVRGPDGTPGLAFKLHQFFAQGGSVYATIEPIDQRYLTLQGQHYAPQLEQSGALEHPLLYPLMFCRECGQEYYGARAAPTTPRSPAASRTRCRFGRSRGWV